MEDTLPDCRVAVLPGQRQAAMGAATEPVRTEVLAVLERDDR